MGAFTVHHYIFLLLFLTQFILKWTLSQAKVADKFKTQILYSVISVPNS